MWSRKGCQLLRDAFNDERVLICDSEMIAFYQTRAESQRVLIVSRQQGFEHAKLSVRRPPSQRVSRTQLGDARRVTGPVRRCVDRVSL
jgi:hypothetical protein